MEKLQKWTIYSITNPKTGNVVYVGRTKNLGKRICQHKSRSHNLAIRELVNFLKLEGIDLIFNVIEVCDSYDFSCERELNWIDFFSKNGTVLLNREMGAPHKKPEDKVIAVTPGLRVNKEKWQKISAKYSKKINKMFNDWLDTL